LGNNWYSGYADILGMAMIHVFHVVIFCFGDDLDVVIHVLQVGLF
jgi:hypothetical protein